MCGFSYKRCKGNITSPQELPNVLFQYIYSFSILSFIELVQLFVSVGHYSRLADFFTPTSVPSGQDISMHLCDGSNGDLMLFLETPGKY